MELRQIDLIEAMKRYVDAGHAIPQQWVDELQKNAKDIIDND